MDASEALLLSERNNRDGWDGDGMFMWVIVLVLIFFAFGWGNGGNRWGNSGAGLDTTALLAAIGAQGRTQDLSQVERDVLQSSCKTQEDVFKTACSTQKEILESRYTTQLGFQNAQAQLAQCCCDLKQAVASDGEQTRALIQGNTIQALRDALEQRDRQLMVSDLFSAQQAQTLNLINTLLPRAVPAYPSCSPYMATYFGAQGWFNNNGCGNCNCGGCGGCCNG